MSVICQHRKSCSNITVLAVLASDLRLGDDQLQGIGVGSVGDGVVENANGLDEMASNARLAREV